MRDAFLFCDAALSSPGQHLFHGPQIAVKLLEYGLWQPRGVKCRTRNEEARFGSTFRHRLRIWWRFKRVWEGMRNKRRSIRWEQGQRKGAGQGKLFQIDQEMSPRRAVSHNLPDRGFYQICWPSSGETALDLFDSGDFSPRPDLLQGYCNFSKGRKRLSPSMQENQIVVVRTG